MGIKESIIAAMENVHDEQILESIYRILVREALFEQENKIENNPQLELALSEAMKQLQEGKGIVHQDVMAEFREKYKI